MITGGEDEPDEGGTRHCRLCALEAEGKHLQSGIERARELLMFAMIYGATEDTQQRWGEDRRKWLEDFGT